MPTGFNEHDPGITILEVLVVEYDDDLRDLCAQTLADAGHAVTAVASAEEALELLSADRAAHDPGITILELDVAVLDLELPGMDGAELAVELSERHPGVAVVVTSGHDPAEFGLVPFLGTGWSFPPRFSIQHEPHHADVEVSFLAKPFTPEQLVEGTRVSERLRHKGRAVTIYDYERLHASVLVVDDDPGVLALTEQTLTDDGHAVTTASSAAEALEFAPPSQDPELVVMDLSLPGAAEVTRRFNCIDCFPRARADEGTGTPSEAPIPTTPLLLISGHDPGDFGIDPDQVAFLAKPFSPAELSAAVDESLRGAIVDLDGPTGDEGLVHRSRRNRFLDHLMGAVGLGRPPDDGAGGRTERTALVGFGSFSKSKRRSLIGAGAVVVVASGAAVALAVGGGAGDSPPEVTDDDPAGTTPTVALTTEPTVDPTAASTAAPAAESSVTPTRAPTMEPTMEPTTEPTTEVTTEPSTEPSTEPTEEVVAYAPPTMHEPVLASCTASRSAAGGTEYAVTFTVDGEGGNYDVLPGEPFIDNDDRVEVRGGTLTWTVETTHTQDRDDDTDPFHVAAPSVFGWAEPGGDARQHTHQPPALAVYADECR